MIFAFKTLCRLQQRPASDASHNPAALALTRRFVLTGDERCPIAGIWSRLDNAAPADSIDEPSLTRPAMGVFPWQAIHLLFMPLRYLPA